MPNPLSLLPLLLLAAPAALEDVPRDGMRDMDGVELAQLVVRERIIIRMSRVPMHNQAQNPVQKSQPAPPPVRIDEKRGPRCVAVSDLAGSAEPRREGVDLALVDGTRLRAKLEDDCPLDFYAGFYVKRPPDGMLCADRDIIRTRAGAACPISEFKKLKVKR